MYVISLMASISPLPAYDSAPHSKYDHALYTFVALLFSALIFFFKSKSKTGSLNLPPGPPSWPVVGNLVHLIRSGKPFMLYVRDIRPIYGPIFTLRFGNRIHIIVSDPDLIHEALIEKGALFANRPAESATRTVYSCDKFTVNSAVYGPVWRSLRRNMVYNMLNSTHLREFRSIRQAAMDRFIDHVNAEARSNDGAVWVLKNARFAVFCILVSMCFGLEMEEDEIVKIDDLMKKVLIILNPRIDDYIPILRPLFIGKWKEAMQLRQEQIQTIVSLIERRRTELRDRSPDNCKPLSYVDTLLDLKIEGRKSSPADAELVTLCSEFLNGGTDTTATAMEWAIARLIDNPHIQAKLHREILSVVGDRKVDENDVEQMPYLNAFVKELLRKHPPTPFSLTHAAVEPAKLGGYDIPSNAFLEFYMLPLSEDPKRWSNPAQFDPDRFLDGRDEADITGIKGLKMLPFGAGRRICPGLSMAMIHVNLMVARMVQEFEWILHPSQQKISFDEKVEFTVVMKTPLRAIIKHRK